MKKKPIIKIETIGSPKLSALAKEDYNIFISSLEFAIADYYKDKKPP